MRLICMPPEGANALPEISDGVLPVRVYARADRDVCASAGAAVVDDVRRRGLVPRPRAWDLLTLALSAVTADRFLPRSISPDGWTRQIELLVGVNESDVWNGVASDIEQMLGFLTTDIWRVSFRDCRFAPKHPRKPRWPSETSVALLSGGLDSLVGAIDLAASGQRPYAVSQTAHGDAEKQRLFAAQIGGGLKHLQTNHNVLHPGASERSQRARSMIFLSYGVLVASCLRFCGGERHIPLYVNENGFIALNPPLTVSRLGSLSTRTAHPAFIGRFQRILERLDFPVELRNPYGLKTKGEMLLECRDQELLVAHAATSTSCGRFRYYGRRHCGRCVPCLVRRAAFHRWGQIDTTEYVFSDLSIDDADHARFDDVRSACMAVADLESSGIKPFLGGALARIPVADTTLYYETAARGLSEIGAFLKDSGVA